MKNNISKRRAFLKATSLAAAGAGTVLAKEKSSSKAHWQPARHTQDDWLERPSQHRLIFDTTTSDGLGDALAFANNYIAVNRTAYNVPESDLAILLIVRHKSTPFGFNDAMWAKYGARLAALLKFEDPKTKQAPKLNVYDSEDYTKVLQTRGVTLGSLAKQGVQFGVCSMATLGMAGIIAKAVGGDAAAIDKELTANLVANARMVPAGIVAVSRAQERGYTLVTAE